MSNIKRAWRDGCFMAAVSILALTEGGVTLAAETGDAPSDALQGMQEIVVTATRRSEVISKVPISIQAYTEQSLEQSGVKSVADLATLTPGVEFDTTAFGTGTLTNIAIRGVNSSNGASTIGLYIDDTPIQTRVTGLSYFGDPLPLMFDVNRVEVERGPQGTLFGAGAEGGAIRFINAEPSLSSYSGLARAETSYTDYGRPSYETGVAVGGPIVADTLGFRASAWYRDDGGYVDRIDPFTGATAAPNVNRQHSYVLRAALTYKPTDALTITPSIYGQEVRSDDQPNFWGEYSNPSQGQLRSAYLLSQPSLDRFILSSLKVENDWGPVTLTSVTSYFSRNAHISIDQTNTDGILLGPYVPYGNPKGVEYPVSYADAAPGYGSTELRQISEELRLSSNDAGARLKWTAGLWFNRTTQVDFSGSYSPFYAVNLFGIAPDGCLFCESLTSIDKQFAAFGQADYRIIDRLTLTLGLRVAKTKFDFYNNQYGPAADPLFPTAAGNQDETPVTPRVGLAYQIDDANMVYVAASKGFRVGGANPPIPIQSPSLPTGCPLPGEPPPYKSDSVWNYEIGAKNKFLDNRLSIATSVYHIDWTNIQQNIFLASCTFGYIANTGKAQINGFDMNLQLAVTHALTLGVATAYTKTEIKDDVAINGFPVVQSGDVIGTLPQVNSPWNLTTSARYDLNVGGHDAYLRLEDIYHSRNPGPFSSYIPTSQTYAPLQAPNPTTNLLNIRAGALFSNVDVSLFVNNVLNRIPELGRFQPGSASTQFTYVTFRPRTVGITGTYRFGESK